MKKYIYLVLGSLLITSCQDLARETEEVIVAEDNIEVKADEQVSIIEEEELEQRYFAHRYTRPQGEGTVHLSIQARTDSTCFFVYDSYGIRGLSYAKLAGELLVDENGYAIFTGLRCELLEFFFSEEGVEVKEIKCDGYHSKDVLLEGYYTLYEPEDGEPNPLIILSELREGSRPFDFYATFTEPFWTLYFWNDVVYFDHMEEDSPDIYIFDKPFDPHAEFQSISIENEDKIWMLTIRKGEGSDGMSEIKYPYEVSLDSNFFGGGGTEFMKEEY